MIIKRYKQKPNIKVNEKIIKELNKIKIHSRETYEQVVERVLGLQNKKVQLK